MGRSLGGYCRALSLARSQMIDTDNITLNDAHKIIEFAATSVELLKQLRDATTDDEWEQIIDNSQVDELITSLFDLEDAVDNCG